MRVEIGKMCDKGSGHLSLIGEDDHGVCGSHYYATVYIELEEEFINEDGDEFEARAERAGRDVAERLNQLSELAWRIEGLEK